MLQLNPATCLPRSSGTSRPLSLPHSWRTGLGLLRYPLQHGSQALRHLSSQRRSPRVQNQHRPGKSSPQTLVSAPWLHSCPQSVGASLALCHQPVAPDKAVQTPQAGGSHSRDGWQGQGLLGTRPGDRKQSSHGVSSPRQGRTHLAAI